MNAITLVGKSLLFIMLALSLLFFGFALGIYTNHIDWPGGVKTATGTLSQGEVGRLTKEVKDWQGQASLARERADKASQMLARLEQKRPEDLAWYAAQLKLLEDGGPDSVKQVVLHEDKNGKLELDAEGHPLMEPPNGVSHSRRGYNEEFDRLKADTQSAIAATTALINQQKELTQIINGEEGKPRGLRALIHEEELTQRSSAEELEHLRPLRINRQVERALLEKRQRSLTARLEELKHGAGTPVTALDSAALPGHTPRP